jgi:predicted lipoprotein with Yx(FWY)xxD motif
VAAFVPRSAPRRASWLALAAALGLLLAACAVEPELAESEADDTAPAEQAPSPGQAPGQEVQAASTALGHVLVDGQGLSLYLFEPDAQGDSTCYDECATAWPPLVTDGEPTAGDGADAGLLGTTTRDDGSTQVTYDGWPLYHWAGDQAPGDVNGQGVNDVWWLVGPDGAPVREVAGAVQRDGY